MRICVQVSTGKILEMQSAAREGTLIANAVSSGIPARDLTEEIVTLAEYRARMAVQEPPKPSVHDKRQAAIDALLLEQAKRLDAPQALKDYAAVQR